MFTVLARLLNFVFYVLAFVFRVFDFRRFVFPLVCTIKRHQEEQGKGMLV